MIGCPTCDRNYPSADESRHSSMIDITSTIKEAVIQAVKEEYIQQLTDLSLKVAFAIPSEYDNLYEAWTQCVYKLRHAIDSVVDFLEDEAVEYKYMMVTSYIKDGDKMIELLELLKSLGCLLYLEECMEHAIRKGNMLAVQWFHIQGATLNEDTFNKAVSALQDSCGNRKEHIKILSWMERQMQ